MSARHVRGAVNGLRRAKSGKVPEVTGENSMEDVYIFYGGHKNEAFLENLVKK